MKTNLIIVGVGMAVGYFMASTLVAYPPFKQSAQAGQSLSGNTAANAS